MFHEDRSRKNLVCTASGSPRPWTTARSTSPSSGAGQPGDLRFGDPGALRAGKGGGVVVRQIVRPTGLTDPEIEIRPVKGQVDDLMEEIRLRAGRDERVLVTTLTKRMAEYLAEYYTELGLRVRYLHSEVETLDRIKIIRFCARRIDALIGINLLREGSTSRVSLVSLDADKEGSCARPRRWCRPWGARPGTSTAAPSFTPTS